MPSFFRRAGAEIARVFASAADPAAETNRSLVYSKAVNAIAQLFARASGGVISQLTPLVTVFDDSVAGTYSNIRGNQLVNRSPIDNTKTGIVNLGSKNSLVRPAATGATADMAGILSGNDNQASAQGACVPGGEGCVASGSWAVAFGMNCQATGLGAFAHGATCVATGTVARAGGNQCLASNDYADAMGSACTASGVGATVRGQSCVASGTNSLAVGDSCTASQTDSSAIGQSCQATAQFGHSRGLFALANRSQASWAWGNFDLATAGQAQTSLLVYRGSTPGLAGAESVVLLSGPLLVQTLLLEDNKAYAFVITCVVGGTQAGPTRISQTFVLKFTAQRIAGTSVITGTGVGDQFGSAGGALWTFAAAVAAAPDRIELTFTTAAVATACKVTARVEMTEVAAF